MIIRILILFFLLITGNAYSATDYLLSVPVANTPVFDDQNPQPLSFSLREIYNDGSGDRQLFMEHSTIDPTSKYTNARLIGAWDEDGLPVGSIHSDYYLILPLGNVEGKATGPIDYPKWQGMPDRNLEVDDTDPENIVVYKYPATNSPFTIRLEHYWQDGTWPGWGWRATMVSDDPARDITTRAIGVYSDADCTQYLYTTGAFVLNGDTYQTETPLGFHIDQVDKPDWYLALLLGAAQEGCAKLSNFQDSVELNFWSN